MSSDAEIQAVADGRITSKPAAERNTVRFTSEGHIMYTIGTGGIVVVNPTNGESQQFTEEGKNKEKIIPLEISQDRKTAVVCEPDTRNYYTWNTSTCKKIDTYKLPPGSQSLAYGALSPCKKYLATVVKEAAEG